MQRVRSPSLGGSRRPGAQASDPIIASPNAYQERYRAVAGADFGPGPIELVGRTLGNRTTPNVRGLWDDEPLDPAERERLVGLLEAT